MADKNRIDHDPENLENLSPEELQKRIEEDKKMQNAVSDLHLQHSLRS